MIALKKYFACVLVFIGLGSAFAQSKVDRQQMATQLWGDVSEYNLDELRESLRQQLLNKNLPFYKDLTFDVSCNGQSFGLNGDLNEEQTAFAWGTVFIVTGYVYPPGTFASAGEDGFNGGILPDGSPEFPELVIGSWTCYGMLYPDLAREGQPSAVSTQVFDLNLQTPGIDIINTGGFEVNSPVYNRTSVSASGRYKNRQGAMTVTVVGYNPSFAPNFLMTFPGVEVL
jgi:hypothetical protein